MTISVNSAAGAKGNEANFVTDSSGNVVGLASPGGNDAGFRTAPQVPYLMHLMDRPLGTLDLYKPVWASGAHDKLYAVSYGSTYAGYSWVYDWATSALSRSTAQIGGGAVTSGYTRGPWRSSTHIFASTKLAAGTFPKLYRSTDGLTWTAVDDLSTWSGGEPTGDYVLQGMCETSSGVLLAAWYNPTLANDDGYTKGLSRSTDGGATWTEISANLDMPVARHVHNVVYDKWRDLVYVVQGDGGDGCSANVSDDDGETWQAMPKVFQCTGVIPTPEFVLLLSDRPTTGSKESGIWRIQGTTVAELQDCDPIMVWDSVYDAKLGTSTAADVGWGWWGWYNAADNTVFVPYSSTSASGNFAQIVGSQDGGRTFGVMASEYDSGGTVSAFLPNCQRPSDYAEWDGWHWIPGSVTYNRAMRPQRNDAAFLIANSTGYANGDGSSARPRKQIPTMVRNVKNTAGHYFTPPVKYKLTEDYDEGLYLSQHGVIIDKNGFDFTAAGVGALNIDESFEGTGAPSGWVANLVGTGAVDWDSTTHAYAGSQSVKCTIASASDQAFVKMTNQNFVNGETWNIQFRAYVDLASMTSGSFKLLNTAGNFYLKLSGGAGGPMLSLANTSGVISYQKQGDERAFPLQEWVNIELRIRKYNGSGDPTGGAELWQNGEKLLSVTGGWNTSSQATESGVNFGIGTVTTLTSANVYIDAVKIVEGSFLPVQTTGLVLTGDGVVVRT